MLVLSRRLKEKILLPGIQVAIQVLAIKPGAVRLGFEAPPDVKVLREEIQAHDAEWSKMTTSSAGHEVPPALPELNRLVRDRLQIAGIGLGLLRGQLQAGCHQEAEQILDKVEEELLMLRQRVVGETAEAPTRPATRARRALLVEDNPNERELMAMFLRMKGFEVDTAGDGLDALEYLHSRQRPDLVLLDMGLPRCDGATTVRRIRQEPAYAGLKIFAVTGRTPEEFDLQAGPAGIDRWFHKPIDPALLVRGVNQELALSPSDS